MLTSISRSSLRQVLLRSMTASGRPMVVTSRFHDQLGFPGLLSDEANDEYHTVYFRLYMALITFSTPVKFVIEK